MTTTTEHPTRTQIEAAYRERTPRSHALYERARAVFPGGDFRRAAFLGPYPPYIERAEGAYLYDADGNRYVDMNGDYTVMVAGHGHPEVLAAVHEAVDRSTALGVPSPNVVELGEALTRRIASLERVRFTCSGTEAVMFAIRGARAFTGKTKIMKMEGAYHGTYDPIEDVKLGVPEAAYGDLVLGRYNDREYTERVFLEHKDELAAVIVAIGVGSDAPRDGFLTFVREITERHGVLFILDEVVSFRLSPGGAQEVYGVRPDLTTMGKNIGGGFAIGAFGGRADVMDVFSPEREDSAHHSGTFVATPVAMAAGLATLRLLDREAIARINQMGESLRDGIRSTLDELEIAGTAENVGSIVTLKLAADAALPARAPGSAGTMTLALMNHGVFARTNTFTVCTPMSDDDIEATVRAVRGSLLAMRPMLA